MRRHMPFIFEQQAGGSEQWSTKALVASSARLNGVEDRSSAPYAAVDEAMNTRD